MSSSSASSSSVPRSQSAPHISSLRIDTRAVATSSAHKERHARPHLPRHRSAVAISSAAQHLVSVYTPRVEREDPFSLSGFFPSSLFALEHPESEQEWDWLRAHDRDARLEDGDASGYRSGLVSPLSESEDEWTVPTPLSAEDQDALAGSAIEREDKLGILKLQDTLFLPSRGDELYAEERLLSPYLVPGDPLDADAVYDRLRALRTAHSLPHGSAVKDSPAALQALFSPEKASDDKVHVEGEGWGALVSWGMDRVVDYISPV